MIRQNSFHEIPSLLCLDFILISLLHQTNTNIPSLLLIFNWSPSYSSLHLVVERMEELMEGTSLEESGWFQGEIFQITCSVSWYGRFWSTTNFWYSWKRAPLPPSSLAGSRRGTEACRAAAGGHGSTTGFVNSISLYFLSYFIQFFGASLGIL